MQELLSPENIHRWLPVALGLAVGLVSIPLALRRQRQTRQTRVLLAQKTGLTLIAKAPLFPSVRFLRFLTGEPRLSGFLCGRQVQIRQTYSDKKTWTEVDAALEGNAPSLRFSARNFLSGLSPFSKKKPVETGDARFDARYSLKSNSPLAATIFAPPEIREAVASVWEKHGAKGTLEVKAGLVRYREAGSPRNEKAVLRIAAAVNLVLVIATAAEAVAEASSGRRGA
jgi:preprotein translocase subunit Sec61beta